MRHEVADVEAVNDELYRDACRYRQLKSMLTFVQTSYDIRDMYYPDTPLLSNWRLQSDSVFHTPRNEPPVDLDQALQDHVAVALSRAPTAVRRLVLSCCDSNGAPAFCPVQVRCSVADVEAGRSNEAATDYAESRGYKPPFLCYEELIGLAWLHEQMEWCDVPVIYVAGVPMQKST